MGNELNYMLKLLFIQYCTWIHQCLLKRLFELLAFDVPALSQIPVHLVTHDHDAARFLPLLKGKCPFLWPLHCSQLGHLVIHNYPNSEMSRMHDTPPQKTPQISVSLTSKLSSSFIPSCHFSNSFSQLRTVLRGQTTRAVVNFSFSQSSKV